MCVPACLTSKQKPQVRRFFEAEDLLIHAPYSPQTCYMLHKHHIVCTWVCMTCFACVIRRSDLVAMPSRNLDRAKHHISSTRHRLGIGVGALWSQTCTLSICIAFWSVSCHKIWALGDTTFVHDCILTRWARIRCQIERIVKIGGDTWRFLRSELRQNMFSLHCARRNKM